MRIHRVSQIIHGLLLCSVSLLAANSWAANNQVVVDDTAIGATTTYTVSFKAAQAINDGGSVLGFNSNGGANLLNASLVSVSGGSNFSLGTASTTMTSVSFTIMTGSSAAVGDEITLVLSNVVNPSSVGQGPDYTVFQFDAFSDPQGPFLTSLPGTIYTASNQPVVVNPIADLISGDALTEGDPEVPVSADLNSVFDDADMDPLSFSLEPGTDSAVVTARIDGSDVVQVTPIGSGRTTVGVRATSSDGSVVDSFDVQVIGLLDNETMTPASLAVGETTSYTLTFNAAGALSAGQRILVNTGPTGPDYTNAGITLTGGNLGASPFLPGDQAFGVSLDSGSAAAGSLITITLTNVVNPAGGGLGPDYLIRVVDSSINLIDQGSAPGNAFEAGGAPFVVNPIADENLREIDGPVTTVFDISTVFDEDDGDPISYNVVGNGDPLVATAALVDNMSGGEALVITPLGPGTSTITVEASDVDGSITDSFDVTILGIMDNASFGPVSSATNALTNYEFSFDTSTSLNDDFVIILANSEAGGPDYSAAQLSSFSGGDLTMAFNAGDETEFSILINGGMAAVGETISFVLSNVRNPSSENGSDYQSQLLRLSPPTGPVESAVIDGSSYQAPVDPVFEDRFLEESF